MHCHRNPATARQCRVRRGRAAMWSGSSAPSSRLPRPHDHPQRDSPAARARRIRRLLQQRPNAPRSRQGRAPFTRNRGAWKAYVPTHSRRPPSPIWAKAARIGFSEGTGLARRHRNSGMRFSEGANKYHRWQLALIDFKMSSRESVQGNMPEKNSPNSSPFLSRIKMVFRRFTKHLVSGSPL